MAHVPAFVQNIDMAWLSAIHAYPNPLFDWAAWILSTIGWAGACWWVLAAVLWFRGYRMLAAQMALAMVFASIGGEALKHITHRIRPSEMFPQFVHMPLPSPHDSRYSFPSGHELLAAAAAFAVVFGSHKNWSWWLVLGAILIGWSRLYMGMHWPSDVFAGLALGIICAVAGVLVSILFENNPIFASKTSRVSSRLPHSQSVESKL